MRRVRHIGISHVAPVARTHFTAGEYAAKTGISVATVRKRIAEMREFVGPGKRYPDSCVLYDGGRMIRVEEEALANFINNRKMLMDERRRGFVEPWHR